MSIPSRPDAELGSAVAAAAGADASSKPLPDSDSPCCGKPAGRPRAAELEARMQNLLDTAGCLFLENGYGKVSLEMIAREAHVAVRTIYVKFGGKAGLFNAVVAQRRAPYFSTMEAMGSDMRPVEEVLTEFALRLMQLITQPPAIRLSRMVIAEAESYPELAMTFYQVGPGQTRELLAKYFARPDVKIRLRDDVPLDSLALHFQNCILGDQFSRLLFPVEQTPDDEGLRNAVMQGLNLFFLGMLRPPPA